MARGEEFNHEHRDFDYQRQPCGKKVRDSYLARDHPGHGLATNQGRSGRKENEVYRSMPVAIFIRWPGLPQDRAAYALPHGSSMRSFLLP